MENKNNISISKNAAEKIKNIISSQEKDLILKISVLDEVSIPYLEGSVIDYKNDLIGQSFEIKNPNATSSCGCGTSFSM